MAWIELHQAIWTHRKTFILAAELNIDETYAAAHMIRLWTWALDNAPDGDLSDLPPKVIAYGAGWQGDAELFVQAAIKAGWLDRDNKSLVIHDWYDYAGRLIEKRRKDMERKRKERQSDKDVQRTSSGHPKDGAGNLTKPNLTITKPNQTIKDTYAPDGASAQPEAQNGEAAGQDPGDHAVNDAPADDVEADKVTVQPERNPAGNPGEQRPRAPFKSRKQQEMFDAFWREYPKRRAKGNAEKAWVKISPGEQLFEAIMDGLKRAKTSADWTRDGGRYIPYPASWLNAKGWEDEYDPVQVAQQKVRVPRAFASLMELAAEEEARERDAERRNQAGELGDS